MKNLTTARISKNAVKDQGDGRISFDQPVVVSSDDVHWDGSRYDVPSMDLSKYDGKLRSDHMYDWPSILGHVTGLAKQGKQLVISGIDFLVNQNPYAQFAYEMVKAGGATDLSVGVEPGAPGDDGLEHNAVLAEISLVGFGNNPAAKINQIAKNAIEQSEAQGLDTKDFRDYLLTISGNGKDQSTDDTIKENSTMSDLKKNDGDDKDETTTVEPTVETPTPSDNPADEAPQSGDDGQDEQPEASDKDDDAVEQNSANAAIAKLTAQVEKLAKHAFDKSAKEPAFVKGNSGEAPASDLPKDWRERTGLQISSYWQAKKQGDSDAQVTLNKINKLHKAMLEKEGLAKNATKGLTDYGNFVTSPELLTEIEGVRTDYSAVLSTFPFQQTNSLEMAWLQRDGDISMTHVAIDPGHASDNDNLKPISEYDGDIKRSYLEELAAVTPVANATTIFLAADLLGDIAQGYRTEYERKLSQLVVARLEQAIEEDASRSQGWNESGSDTDAVKLNNVRDSIFSISQGNGILVMNEASFGQILGVLYSTGNGGQIAQGALTGELPLVWGKRVLVVPNELLPTLGDTTTYKTFTVGDNTDGAGTTNVTINHAIFYVDPGVFSGRQNGGLRYDLSTDAAYERSGTVYSAYQRNELVVRGSMFRGGAVRDTSRVRGVRAANVIS